MKTLELTQALIRKPSVTPKDCGCQTLIADRLAKIGFDIQTMNCEGVSNLWARLGNEPPLLAFAGHTDVVPTGDLAAWKYPPFDATIEGNLLYGRGAADMKGGVAAMATACERFAPLRSRGSLALLLTSDEEGPALHGTKHVVDTLQESGTKIDWCVIGEPSCSLSFGDSIKHGRRGTLTGYLRINGIQGHIAYPEKARNPIHESAQFFKKLCAESWDEGNDDFPPTSLQIVETHAGVGADNVIPATLKATFNFRYSTAVSDGQLRARVVQLLNAEKLDYELKWHTSGKPFLTRGGKLKQAVCTAVAGVTGILPQPSTAGGTSDGRFIAPAGAEVIEFGTLNDSIHKINEHVHVGDLERLSEIYYRVMTDLLGD